MFSHPETGSDQPIGSDRESGRDMLTILRGILHFFNFNEIINSIGEIKLIG